jgi:hypothetical protein
MVKNLTSTTTSLYRRSFHWKFDTNEVDVSIDKETIYFCFVVASENAGVRYFTSNFGDPLIELQEWLEKDPYSMYILSWFGSTSDLLDFIRAERDELLKNTNL